MDISAVIISFLVNILPVLSIVYIIVGYHFLKNRLDNHLTYFSFFMFACALYTFGYFLELNIASVELFLLVRNIEALGMTFIPAFGLLFIAQFADIRISRKIEIMFFLLSGSIWLLFITNPMHSFFYRSIEILVLDYSVPLTVKGPVYYVLLIWYIVFLVGSIIMLFNAYKKTEHKTRKNSVLFVLGSFQIGWVTLIFILGGYDVYIDPTPATIIFITTMFAINEIRNDMITGRIQMEKKLKQSEERYKTIITLSHTGAWEYYRETNYLWCSHEYFSMLGYDSNDFQFTGDSNLKEVWEDLIHPEDQNRAVAYFAKYLSTTTPSMYEQIFRMKRNDGQWAWILSRGQTLRSETGMLSQLTVGVHIDITEQKQLEQELRKLSNTDKLTQLCNRLKIDEILDGEIIRANRTQVVFAVILLDIDFFKTINDQYGHQVGDQALVELAHVLRESIRLSDSVGRWGGEEFLIIAPDTDILGARSLAEKLRARIIDQKFNTISRMTCSFGVAEWMPGDKSSTIISRADQALYKAKHNGRNRVH